MTLKTLSRPPISARPDGCQTFRTLTFAYLAYLKRVRVRHPRVRVMVNVNVMGYMLVYRVSG